MDVKPTNCNRGLAVSEQRMGVTSCNSGLCQMCSSSLGQSIPKHTREMEPHVHSKLGVYVLKKPC